MAATDSLLSQMKGYITPDFISKAGSLTGESPEKAKAGMMSAISALLSGLIHKGSTHEGANDLLNTIREDGYDQGVPSNYLEHLHGGKHTDNYFRKGNELVQGLFGKKSASIADELGSSSGLRPGSAMKMLAMLAPLMLGLIGSKVKQGAQGQNQDQDREMSPAELTSYLGNQSPSLKGLLPVDVTPTEERRREKPAYGDARRPTPVVEKKSSLGLPLLLAVLLLIGGLFLFRGFRTPNVEMPTAPAVSTVEEPVKPAEHGSSNEAVDQTKQMAGQTEQAVAPQNETIAGFLSSSAQPVPKRFIYADLQFDKGAVKPNPGSTEALGDVASALKSHPSSVVRIEGNTDNTGNQAMNKKLSMERADSVKNALIADGVGISQLTTTGLGDSHPIASNDTDTGRQENRRIDIVVVQK